MRKRFRISSLIVHLLGLISLALLLSILAYSNLTVTAKTWDYKYKAFLPDSAFAAIEDRCTWKKGQTSAPP